MADDLGDTIETEAGKPKATQSDDVTITRRDLRELIEADRYLQSKASAGSARRGLRFNKLSPPGTT